MRFFIIAIIALFMSGSFDWSNAVAAEKSNAKKLPKKAPEKPKQPVQVIDESIGLKVETESDEALDLKVDSKLEDEFGGNYEVPDLESEYNPLSGRERGDVKFEPEFRYVEDPDITKSGDYEQEKEFKLKVNVGL